MPSAIFFSGGKNDPISVLVEASADEVGERLRANPTGFEQFETKGRSAFWINARNVLYVEDRSSGEAPKRTASF